MQSLADFLQKDPTLIITLFFIGLIGTVIGIVTGWSQFFASIKRKVSVPLWVILLFIGVSLIVYLNKGGEPPKTVEDYEVITNRKFGVESVAISGKNFINCEFIGTQLIYDAKAGCIFSEGTVSGITLMLDGPAVNMNNFYSSLYQTPTM